jgi:hypothetical protein
MPPKPTRRRYREPIAAPGELPPMIVEFLLTGRGPGRDAPAEVRGIEFEYARWERLWRTHRRRLVAEARVRGFSPFAMREVDGKGLPGLPQWRLHRPDPLPTLAGRRVRPCAHCGSADLAPTTCLA